MDLLALLDELQTIARNGLAYATNPYDRERYEKLLALACRSYGQALDLPPAEVRGRLSAELGYITPKVGADAAVFDEDGRILLVQRSDDATWCLPCGWSDPNETPAQTALRELREETGLEGRAVELVDVFTRLPSAETGPHTMVAIVYLCDVTGGELSISHESLDVRYWRIEDVPSWHPTHEQPARAARERWLARERWVARQWRMAGGGGRPRWWPAQVVAGPGGRHKCRPYRWLSTDRYRSATAPPRAVQRASDIPARPHLAPRPF